MHMHTIQNCLVSMTLTERLWKKIKDQTMWREKEQTTLNINWHWSERDQYADGWT
jgi:hypothetical protein